LLTGTIYTARDAAHKKLFELLDGGRPLPFDLKDAVIYYAGPTPGHGALPSVPAAPPPPAGWTGLRRVCTTWGSCATIGKGERSSAVADAIVRNGAVYLCAVGGAGALISRHIDTAEEIAFLELGCESVKRLLVRDLPLTVALDCHGGDIFREGREKYRLA
jgi:fumarate hydratase subunit beta